MARLSLFVWRQKCHPGEGAASTTKFPTFSPRVSEMSLVASIIWLRFVIFTMRRMCRGSFLGGFVFVFSPFEVVPLEVLRAALI